jgi:hypothetical protein
MWCALACAARVFEDLSIWPYLLLGLLPVYAEGGSL